MTKEAQVRRKLTHTKVLVQSLAMLAGLCLAIYVLLEIIYPRALALITGMVPSSSRQYAACQSNLKMVAAALDEYADNNEGVLPENHFQLIPDYLQALPQCPAAKRMSYHTEFRTAGTGEHYRVICAGGYHRMQGCTGRFPALDSALGMMKNEPGDAK